MALLTSPKKTPPSIVSASVISEVSQPIEMVKNFENAYTPTYVDLKWAPEQTLLTHIEGSPWVVDYYSQVLTEDSDLSGQQVTASGVYQQYTQISSMEMRVSSPLESSQEEQGKSITVSGSAITYPFLIPNPGDMFVAEIEPGRLALFRVINTTKKSIFNQSCFEISYGLDTTDTYKIEDIKKKVVKTYFYYQDYLHHGQSPLLIDTQARSLVKINKRFDTLLDYYLRKFLSVEYSTLMVPDQKYIIHDPFLTEFFLDTVPEDRHHQVKRIRKMNTWSDQYTRVPSIWDCILERDSTKIQTIFSKFFLVGRAQFDRIPSLAGFRYSGIQYIVYPQDGVDNVDNFLFPSRKLAAELKLESSYDPEKEKLWRAYSQELYPIPLLYTDERQSEYLDPTPVDDPYEWIAQTSEDRYKSTAPINLLKTTKSYQMVIPPVSIENHYFFNELFYQLKPTTSFEAMVIDFIYRKPIDEIMLSDLSELCVKWGALEQFYYIPVIMRMMKKTITGV